MASVTEFLSALRFKTHSETVVLFSLVSLRSSSSYARIFARAKAPAFLFFLAFKLRSATYLWENLINPSILTVDHAQNRFFVATDWERRIECTHCIRQYGHSLLGLLDECCFHGHICVKDGSVGQSTQNYVLSRHWGRPTGMVQIEK